MCINSNGKSEEISQVLKLKTTEGESHFNYFNLFKKFDNLIVDVLFLDVVLTVEKQ